MALYQQLITHIDNFNSRLKSMIEISKLSVEQREARYVELLKQEPKFDRSILVPPHIKNRISNELGLKALSILDSDIFLRATLSQVVIAKKSVVDLTKDIVFNHHQSLMDKCKKDLEAYERYSRVCLPRVRNWLDSVKTSTDFKQLCREYDQINKEYQDLMIMSSITDALTLDVMTKMGL